MRRFKTKERTKSQTDARAFLLRDQMALFEKYAPKIANSTDFLAELDKKSGDVDNHDAKPPKKLNHRCFQKKQKEKPVNEHGSLTLFNSNIMAAPFRKDLQKVPLHIPHLPLGELDNIGADFLGVSARDRNTKVPLMKSDTFTARADKILMKYYSLHPEELMDFEETEEVAYPAELEDETPQSTLLPSVKPRLLRIPDNYAPMLVNEESEAKTPQIQETAPPNSEQLKQYIQQLLTELDTENPASVLVRPLGNDKNEYDLEAELQLPQLSSTKLISSHAVIHQMIPLQEHEHIVDSRIAEVTKIYQQKLRDQYARLMKDRDGREKSFKDHISSLEKVFNFKVEKLAQKLIQLKDQKGKILKLKKQVQAYKKMLKEAEEARMDYTKYKIENAELVEELRKLKASSTEQIQKLRSALNTYQVSSVHKEVLDEVRTDLSRARSAVTDLQTKVYSLEAENDELTKKLVVARFRAGLGKRPLTVEADSDDEESEVELSPTATTASSVASKLPSPVREHQPLSIVFGASTIVLEDDSVKNDTFSSKNKLTEHHKKALEELHDHGSENEQAVVDFIRRNIPCKECVQLMIEGMRTARID